MVASIDGARVPISFAKEQGLYPACRSILLELSTATAQISAVTEAKESRTCVGEFERNRSYRC